MFTLVLIVHIIVSMILVLVVLLQSGKAGDLASTFGGATSQTAFGARGAATLLTKVTTVCAVLFMVTSLSLAVLYNRGAGSVMDSVPYPEELPSRTAPESTTPDSPRTPPEQSTPPAEPPAQNESGPVPPSNP